MHPGDHCVGYVIEAGHTGSTTPATRPWVDPGVRGADVAFVPINGQLGNLDGPKPRGSRRGRSRARRALPLRHVRVQHREPGRIHRRCERLGQPYRVLQGERLSLD